MEMPMNAVWPLIRAGFFRFDPETAHGLSIKALKAGIVPRRHLSPDSRLSVEVAGIRFPNPLGLAAGYDKNAEVPDAILRLVKDEAIINRFGFNSEGHGPSLARLKARGQRGGIVGVNIGANKEAVDRIADYIAGIRAFAEVATYFTANISSPNTPGLRDLQARDSLRALLAAVLDARDEEAGRLGRRVPVFLKIAPDLTEEGLDDVAAEIRASALDGLIVSNTTLSRAGLTDQAQAAEAGGMSGRPLFDRSTIVLAKMRQRLGGNMPIIGVGGVRSVETAAEKIRAGADLVQLYSSMVYEGPGLPARIVRGLGELCDRERLGSIRDLRDKSVDQWATRELN
jgi:dihydroorotate dehydrogenase